MDEDFFSIEDLNHIDVLIETADMEQRLSEVSVDPAREAPFSNFSSLPSTPRAPV